MEKEKRIPTEKKKAETRGKEWQAGRKNDEKREQQMFWILYQATL